MWAETLEDIVAIERLSGGGRSPCDGRFNGRDRVFLRRAWLMREGQIVHAVRHPVDGHRAVRETASGVGCGRGDAERGRLGSANPARVHTPSGYGGD